MVTRQVQMVSVCVCRVSTALGTNRQLQSSKWKYKLRCDTNRTERLHFRTVAKIAIQNNNRDVRPSYYFCSSSSSFFFFFFLLHVYNDITQSTESLTAQSLLCSFLVCVYVQLCSSYNYNNIVSIIILIIICVRNTIYTHTIYALSAYNVEHS